MRRKTGKTMTKCRISETPDYDPRHDSPRTVEDAKGRYVSTDLPGYGLLDLEQDLDRLLDSDRDSADGGGDDEDDEKPELATFEGQVVMFDGGTCHARVYCRTCGLSALRGSVEDAREIAERHDSGDCPEEATVERR